jgi:hypothetical protein
MTFQSGRYFELKGKRAEEVVHELAERTFLSPWCFPNPKWPDGNELCDLLIWFDNIVIIWQIKDLKIGKDGQYKKKSVEKNIRQLKGAKRKLFKLKKTIELENPIIGCENFNPIPVKEIFLISAFMGDDQEISPMVQSLDENVIHIFNRKFTEIALAELDTVKDFTEYLRAREKLIENKRAFFVEGGEEDLLAYYLIHKHSFDQLENFNFVHYKADSWNDFIASTQYRRKKEEDEISYGWDSFIELAPLKSEDSESHLAIVREMASCSRLERRSLSKFFYERQVAAQSLPQGYISRHACVAKGVSYAFLFVDDNVPHSIRIEMLKCMCLVLRQEHPDNAKVLGIATDKIMKPTFSPDYMFIEIKELTIEIKNEIRDIQANLEIFSKAISFEGTEYEFPEE